MKIMDINTAACLSLSLEVFIKINKVWYKATYVIYCSFSAIHVFMASVHQWSWRPGLNPRSSHTKDSKNSN